jgi:hypothetical protein
VFEDEYCLAFKDSALYATAASRQLFARVLDDITMVCNRVCRGTAPIQSNPIQSKRFPMGVVIAKRFEHDFFEFGSCPQIIDEEPST